MSIIPCCDHERRTCIQVERVDGRVKYIPLDVSLGLEVQTTSADVFDRRYRPMADYPAEKAAQLYLSYSQNIGATAEALKYLGQIINITKQEYEMATAKKSTKAPVEKKTTATKAPVEKKTTATKAPVEKKAEATKAPVEKKTTATKAPVEKKTAATKAPVEKKTAATKAPVEKKAEAKRESAAQMFQDLIMAGELTDDQIFEKVQEKFGLDEKKRGYVKWYRSHLKKLGKNPPEAKVAK